MIRGATAADLPALLAIQAETLAEPWPALLRAAIEGPASALVVADERDAPLGYALVTRAGETAYVVELAIAPPAQDQGLGSRLLDALLDRLSGDGVETVRLTARAEDQRLHAFYTDRGFEITERVPDHYDDADGLIFEATLPEVEGPSHSES